MTIQELAQLIPGNVEAEKVGVVIKILGALGIPEPPEEITLDPVEKVLLQPDPEHTAPKPEDVGLVDLPCTERAELEDLRREVKSQRKSISDYQRILDYNEAVSGPYREPARMRLPLRATQHRIKFAKCHAKWSASTWWRRLLAWLHLQKSLCPGDTPCTEVSLGDLKEGELFVLRTAPEGLFMMMDGYHLTQGCRGLHHVLQLQKGSLLTLSGYQPVIPVQSPVLSYAL